MTRDDTQAGIPAPQERPGPAVSRRTLMKTAAGAGIAIAAVGMVGIAQADTGTARQAAMPGLAGAPLGTTAAGGGSQITGTLVAHVLDAHAGTIELFGDGTRSQVHNTDLATRIGRVAGGSPVVVHVLDASTGTLEVFSNGSRSQIRDTDLAHRIVTAA